MVNLGGAAREIRDALGLTQQEMATRLEVTNVHVSNVENGKSNPSPELIDRYRRVFGLDLYVLAWCRQGDVEQLPAEIRKPADLLARAFMARFEQIARQRRKANER